MSNSTLPTETLLQRVFQYQPNRTVALTVGELFTVVGAALFFRTFRRKDWWSLCLPLGTLVYATGFKLRIGLAANPNSLGIFMAVQLFLICSPGAFLAFNYIVYGRLIRNRVGPQFSLVKPHRVARLFVISDVTSFLIQASGGGLEAIKSAAKLGSWILLTGLITQAISYVMFIALLVHSHRRIAKNAETMRQGNPIRVIWLLYFSSLFIVIRSLYRVIEQAQGNGGFLLTHEIYFYTLDALPLLFAIVVYIPFWPGKYVEPESSAVPGEGTGVHAIELK